jgi:hypothetical protein
VPIILALILFNGLTHDYLETSAWPNQGIWLSARSALIGLLLAGIGAGGFVLIVQLLLRGQGIEIGPLFSLYCGLVPGLVAGYILGGGNTINHIVLRILLWQQGSTPRDFVTFLNEAARHILLFRVGGGYIFTHRLLQDHLRQ